MKVDFYRHSMSADDAARVAQVLDSPFLTSGSVCREVEAQIAAFFDVPHATLTNSWTNGAVAVLLALGIGPGDEVIVPAMTFVATANVAHLVGARPVFVDVDPKTLLLTADGIKRALTPQTRAVIPVHLYGQMCDMTAIYKALEDRPDISIIEDAAHCFEGSRDGYLPGANSAAAIFSFYATKNIACGEGGAIIARDGVLFERILQARTHGMSATAVDRYHRDRYRHWDMVRLGTKANLPDLLAALLPEQIATIRDRLPARQALADRYRAALADGPLRLVAPIMGGNSAEHLFPIHVPPPVRDDAIAALNAAGVGVAVHYRSVPSVSFYRESHGINPETWPVSLEWGGGTLSLPLYERLTEKQQDYVIGAITEHVYPLCTAAAH